MSGASNSAAGDAAVPHHEHQDPLKAGEVSRIWRPESRPGVELLYGKYRRFSFARHFHPVAAIGVVEQGVMSTGGDGESVHAPASTVVLFNAGDVHGPHSSTPEGWAFRMFYFDDEVWPSLMEDGFDAERRFSGPFSEDPQLAAHLLHSHRSFEQADQGMEAESYLVLALQRLFNSASLSRTPRAVERGAKVKRAIDYLRAHSMHNVSLSQLADATALSPYHLLRSFHSQVGITPHAYLTQVRIESSCMLLRSGVSIAQTAVQLGFVDQSHFTRKFKKFMGVTPGRFCRKS